ncbi:MAG: phage/plasmid primase, P4 family [Nocardioidaceae bacterium]
MIFPTAPEGSAAAALFDSVVAAGGTYAGYTKEGGTFTCPSPYHEDSHPSFDVTVADSGKPLFNCKPCLGRLGNDTREWINELAEADVEWHGWLCEPDDVEWGAVPAEAGSGVKPTKGDQTLRRSLGEVTGRYTYYFADGSPNFRVLRFESDGRKTFRVYHWQADHGGYAPGFCDTQRTPYHLEQFEAWAEAEKVLYLVEGEKPAEALISAGKAATTFAGGASGTLDEAWTDWLASFGEVRVWPDADETGVRRGQYLARALRSAGVAVSMWGSTSDDTEPKDDAYDVLERGDKPHRLSGTDAEVLAALAPSGDPAGASRGLLEPHDGSDDAAEADGEPGSKPIVSAEPVGPHGKPKAPPYPVLALGEPRRFAQELVRREFLGSAGAEMAVSDAESLSASSEDAGRVLTPTLRYQGPEDAFWLWDDSARHYTRLHESSLTARLNRLLGEARETTPGGAKGPPVVQPVKVKPTVVAPLATSLESVILDADAGDYGALLDASGGVPFRNGWLDVASGSLRDYGPEHRILWAVPADYSPTAKCNEWLAFLDSIGFTEGTDERLLLQEWMGYLLSGRTDLNKAMLLIGPPRSGKGTIQDVCHALLGDGAVGMSVGSLASEFGLEPAIGKSLATIGDARFTAKTDKELYSRILSITGGDEIAVNQKHKAHVSLKPTFRLMFATNEPPHLAEASDALVRRFVLCGFTKSFLDAEDLGLKARVRAEVPGIARWALEGLRRLESQRYFTETEAGKDLTQDILTTSSPVQGWLAERAVVDDPDGWSEKDELYRDFRSWCEARGVRPKGYDWFFRDLYTARPSLTTGRPRRSGQTTRPRVVVGITLADGKPMLDGGWG